MKIIAFADFHGNTRALRQAVQIASSENPSKVVICGDLFGGWSDDANEIDEILRLFDATLYLVRGNNDRGYDTALLSQPMEDYAVFYAFGRTMFFTHGDRYNAYNPPPILRQGDVLVHGHTHVGFLRNVNGLTVANVGSMSLPRDGVKSYLVLDENGACLKDTSGNVLQTTEYCSTDA